MTVSNGLPAHSNLTRKVQLVAVCVFEHTGTGMCPVQGNIVCQFIKKQVVSYAAEIKKIKTERNWSFNSIYSYNSLLT